MSLRVDYYLSLISPWTYLGHDRLVAIADRAGAQIAWKPVDLGRIFPETGGLPLKQRSVQRQAYRMMELRRWPDRLGVPLNPEPRFFPADETRAARMVLQAIAEGGNPAGLIGGVLTAVWAEDRDIADPETLVDIARRNGFDSELPVRAEAAAEEHTRTRDAFGREALAAGVFGAPTYVVGDELFWGQDRLDFVAARLGVALD